MVIIIDALETPMYATTQECIHFLLSYRYEAENDRPTSPKNKPSVIGDTDQQIYINMDWRGMELYALLHK